MPRWLLLSLLLLCLPLAAWAQYVTVDFAAMPIDQAFAELERQTGAHISHFFRGQQQPPVVDLQMKDAPLRAVLRGLCQQANCNFRQYGHNYISVQPGADPTEACPTTKAGPYTIRLRNIRITDALTLSFEAGADAPLTAQNDMAITLSLEADDDLDLDAVAALHPGVTAVENTGKTIAPKSKDLPQSYGGGVSPAYQGFIQHTVALDKPSPEAASLRTLEGDILVYKDVQPVRFEFPLRGEHQPQTAAGHTVTITSITPVGEGGYEVKLEWRLPPRTPEQMDRPWRSPSADAYLVTAQGARIGSGGTSMNGRTQGNQMIYNCTWQFNPSADLVPDKFVLAFTVKGEETETLHYKFADIPLPTWNQ